MPSGRAVHSGDQAAPFLLHCLRSCHPLSQSDYLEIRPPAPGPVPLQLGCQFSNLLSNGGQGWSRGSFRQPLGCSGQAGPGWSSRLSRNPPLLLSAPDRGTWQSGQAQICLSVSGTKLDTNLPLILSAHQVGHLAGPQFFLPHWFGLGNLERRKNSILVAVMESVRNLGSWMPLSLGGCHDSRISHFLNSPVHRNLGSKYRLGHNGAGWWVYRVARMRGG